MAPVLLNTLTNALGEWTLTALQMTPPWGQQLVRAGLPLRGTTTGWGKEPTGPLWNSWGQRQSPAPVKKQLRAMTQPGGCWAGAAPWKKPWGCWWAAERATRHMGTSAGHYWLLSQGKGLSPSVQHSSDQPTTLLGFGPPNTTETSSGGSDEAGRDSSPRERLVSPGEDMVLGGPPRRGAGLLILAQSGMTRARECKLKLKDQIW